MRERERANEGKVRNRKRTEKKMEVLLEREE